MQRVWIGGTLDDSPIFNLTVLKKGCRIESGRTAMMRFKRAASGVGSVGRYVRSDSPD